MAKKRGLAANRGLDALLGSIKKEKKITAVALRDDVVSKATDTGSFNDDNGERVGTQTDIPSDKQADSILGDATKKTDHSPDKIHTNKRRNSKKSAGIDANSDKVSVETAINTDNSQNSASTTNRKNHSANGSKLAGQKVHNSDAPADEMMLVQMAVDRLQPGRYQPRRDMGETALTELASSIEQHGVMQPIVIRPLLDREDKTSALVTHEIIAGERRWRAAKMAGLDVIPAIERVLSDELAIALALIENIQREDLSVIEQAAALQRFHTEFGMSHAMIAEVVGKARTTVSNLLRLNHLHDTVKDQLNDKLLDMGHARALLSLSLEQQPIIAQKIIDATMTVREAEKLVKSILKPEKTQTASQVASKADIERLNQQLSDYLGAPVKLKKKKDGKGSVEIQFQNDAELAEILKHFK